MGGYQEVFISVSFFTGVFMVAGPPLCMAFRGPDELLSLLLLPRTRFARKATQKAHGTVIVSANHKRGEAPRPACRVYLWVVFGWETCVSIDCLTAKP